MQRAVLRRILWVAVLACAGGQAATLPESGAAQIREYLQQAQSGTHIPGMVALVTDEKADLFVAATGKQDVAKNVPMRNDSIFRIASMTKPVTSVAVMQLVEQNKVGLDDPIARYLPQFKDKPVFDTIDTQAKTYTTRPATGPVTVRHLLTHTSGLGYPFTSEALLLLSGGGLPNPSTAALPLLHDPGAKWTYSESTRVLGQLVEKVSGMPLDKYLSEKILVPLGMTDTGFVTPAAKHDRVVTIHRTTDKGLVEVPNPEGDIGAPVQGDGGLNSTAADYARFIRMFLNGGRAPNGTRILSEATVRQMGENHIGPVRVSLQAVPAPLKALSETFPLNAGEDTFGLGFQVRAPHKSSDERSAGSLSWAGIFNTEFWIDPGKRIGGVLLMQYLPFYDAEAIATLQGFEQRVYRNIR